MPDTVSHRFRRQLKWADFQLSPVLARLITESIHDVLRERDPVPIAEVFRKRLEIAVKYPQPDNVNSEIEQAAALLVQ